MIITIKTIDKKTIELEGTYETISDIKNYLKNKYEFDIDRQQLIFKGRVMVNCDLIGDLDLENNFIVLLLKKQKIINKLAQPSQEKKLKTETVEETLKTETVEEKPKTETVEGNPKTETVEGNPNTETVVNREKNPLTENNSTTNISYNQEVEINSNSVLEEESLPKDDDIQGFAPDIPQNTETSLSVSPPSISIPENPNINEFKQDEELVSNLTNMGFEINDVKQALTLAKNNKNFALNILMEPELLDQLIHEQVDNGSLNINIPQNSNNDASTMPQMTEEQLLELIEQNPQEFQQLVGGLCNQFPEISQMLESDPEQFIKSITQILNSTVNQESTIQDNDISSQTNTDLGADNNTQINISQEEEAKLNTLQQMFPHIPKITILETLKACNNDDSLSANLLFDFSAD